MRVAIVFDVDDETGYRIGEYLDSDVQPVLIAYRDRDDNNVILNAWPGLEDAAIEAVLE